MAYSWPEHGVLPSNGSIKLPDLSQKAFNATVASPIAVRAGSGNMDVGESGRGVRESYAEYYKDRRFGLFESNKPGQIAAKGIIVAPEEVKSIRAKPLNRQ